MAKVFICYRQNAYPNTAALIQARLEARFGVGSVVMDLEIPPGANVQRFIMDAIDQSDAFLVIMPPDWIHLSGKDGWTLEEPRDWVRQEIEAAQKRDCLIVPVLIEGAQMPSAKERENLPFLGKLWARNGIPLTTRQARAVCEAISDQIDDFARQQKRAKEAFAGLRELWNSGRWVDARDHVEQVLASLVSQEPEIYRPFADMLIQGQWEQAQKYTEQILAEPGREYLTPYCALIAKRTVAEQLARLTELLRGSAFDQASILVKTVDPVEGPESLDAVKALLDTLLRAAANAHSFDVLTQCRESIKNLEPSLPVDLPGRSQGMENITALIDRWHQRYQEANEHYDGYRISAAHDLYSALEGLEVSDKRERCRTWLDFFAAARGHDWGKARTALGILKQNGETDRAQSWRSWCKLAEGRIAVLDRMIASDWVPAPKFPWPTEECPYEVLGTAPDTRPEKIKDDYGSARDEQRKGAWNALRRTETRLRVDFGLYRIRDRAGVARILERFFCVEEGRDPEQPPVEAADGGRGFWAAFSLALGADLGVFYALRGDLASAVRTFLDLVRRAPHDPRGYHHLFLAAAAAAARYADEKKTVDGETWDGLILALGATLADDRFWHAWWADHRRVYPIERGQVEEARSTIQSEWMERIQDWAGPGEYPAMELRVEINGARAVNAGEGIVLSGPTGHSIAVLGRLGIRCLGKTVAAAQWTGGLGQACLGLDGWQRQACLYLSQLGEALSLFEEGRYTEALACAESLSLPADGAFADLNPGLAGFPTPLNCWCWSRDDLRVRAHQRCALQAISTVPPEVPGALNHWRKAWELCDGLAAKQKLTEGVARQVRGRTKGLRQRNGDDHAQLAVLDEVVDLLSILMDRGWDELTVQLEDDLVEALLDRSVLLSNSFDREQDAREDARRAWGLRPRLLRAIQSLCWASLHYAGELNGNGQGERAQDLVNEVVEYLNAAEADYPEDPDLARARTKAKALQRTLNLGGAGPDELLKQMLQDVASSPDDSFETRLSEAAVLETQQDYPGAMDIYRDLAAKKTQYSTAMGEEVRGRMAWCYRLWIAHLRKTGAPAAEVRRLTQEAVADCPGSGVLADLFQGRQRVTGGDS